MYVAYIRLRLEYSDSVWDNCSIATKTTIRCYSHRDRIITGATKLCSIEKPFFKLGWESFQGRRNKDKLVIFYKILRGLTPNYLSDLVPPTVQKITTYSLRNPGHIQTYRANRNLFLDSFYPTTRAWNSLPSEVQQASSVAVFKSSLNGDLHTPPKYFNSGWRKSQILQARLRMGCSSLNSDLYRKHIVPSPSCQSEQFESAAHFFFNCLNYDEV